MKGLALTDPKRLFNTSNEKYFREINAIHDHEEATVDYLYKTLSETMNQR